MKRFSSDIKMEFGLGKCAKATFKRKHLTSTSNIHIDNSIKIKLEQEKTYDYPEVNEGNGIQHAAMKEKIQKEYYKRVRLVLKSELNASNRAEATYIMAVPVVTYSFNFTNWKLSEIKKLDTKTRKLLTMGKMHHPRSDVDRLYLPRARSRRGLTHVELSYKTTTIGLAAYLTSTNDSLIRLVQQHESTRKKLYSIIKEASKFKKELDLKELQPEDDETATLYAKRIKTPGQNTRACSKCKPDGARKH